MRWPGAAGAAAAGAAAAATVSGDRPWGMTQALQATEEVRHGCHTPLTDTSERCHISLLRSAMEFTAAPTRGAAGRGVSQVAPGQFLPS